MKTDIVILSTPEQLPENSSDQLPKQFPENFPEQSSKPIPEKTSPTKPQHKPKIKSPKYFIKNESGEVTKFKSEKEYFTVLAEKLITHLKSGFSSESFPYEDASIIEKYFILKEEGVENFPGSLIFRIRQAQRICLRKWEKIALTQVEKETTFFPASTWIFCMKNFFNWSNSPEKLNTPNPNPAPRTIRIDGNGWDEVQ